VFSTITATGGGAGFSCASIHPQAPGGSGGGARYYVSVTGAGNTPPVSPSQGNPGGIGSPPASSGNYPGGGGGGAGAAGTNGLSPCSSPGGPGGVGVSNSITGSTVFRAGGGGAGFYVPGGAGAGGNGGGGAGNGTAGTSNTGGGGGSNGVGGAGGNGGSGIVVIRYKFQ
jgi:hypothetical protein